MDKEQTAIERLKTASEMSLAVYGLPLAVTTSDGKDSSVCVALAERAGIPFEILHNHTTADAPERKCGQKVGLTVRATPRHSATSATQVIICMATVQS